jgi:toxin-antitoxin system PIN domain toxin
LNLADVNLLIYAYDPRSPHHAASRSWFEKVLLGPEPLALTWITIHGFIRITTNDRAFPRPLSITEAYGIASDWMRRPTACMLHPGERHWEILGSLLQDGGIRGPLVSDAALAAIAIEHGATLCTTDRDFLRFPKLKWRNPLEAAR